MNDSTGEKTPSGGKRKSFFREFLDKLRKRHIIKTLAAFIGGGWLILEFVDRLLVAHYHFPDETIDLAFVTILAALICTILWRWFRGTEKRPGNVKVEVLLVPLIILTALCIDLNIVFDIAGISGKRWLIGIIALCLGIAWIIFKSLQWAAIEPAIISGQAKAEIEISPLAPASPEKSIAVLPFVNISPEEGQDYFCDGMTEEIITDLSHVHDLLVISRSSAMTFKGTKKTIPEIARAVNVRYVLEGSVRKAGNSLRIAAQLIDAETDVHLWADKYAGTLDDVFDIQEKLSRKIVNALRVKLSSEEEGRISARPIEDVHAYECYQLARREVLRGTEEGLSRALQLIETALDIVGKNELLYAALAYVHLESVNLVIAPDEVCLKEVEECTKKIFALNADSPHGHFFKGAIEYKRGNIQEAVRVLKRSFAKEPNNPNTLFYLSGLLGFSGKPSAGLPYATRLREIDPLTPLSQFWWAWVGFLHTGQFDELLNPMQMAYQMDPEAPFLVWGYATALALNLRLEEAYDIIDRLAARSPENTLAKLCVLLRHALQGNKERALQSVTPDFVAAVRWDEHLSWTMADCYALLDQKVDALNWLEHASLNRGFINYPLLAEKDPWLANIRGEPRFQKLMERVKYEWEHFEV